MDSRLKVLEFKLCPLSLYQDLPHGFDVFVTIIWSVLCLISTRVGVIMSDLLYQTNWEVTERTLILLVSSDANSCFGLTRAVFHRIESFLFALRLQWGLWTNQYFPRVTTQRGGAVFLIGDQWVQWVGLPVDDNEPELTTNIHSRQILEKGVFQ